MAVRKAAMLLTSALCALPAIVQGYSIDSSCDSIKDYLKDSVEQSMEMVDTAKDAVRKDPMDDEVKRLAKMLFDEKDIPALEDIFMGMGMERNLKPGGAEPKNHPTIYCNLDRLDPGKKTWTLKGKVTQVYDRVNDVTFPEASNSHYEGCRLGTVMAFTTIFGNPGHKHSIQLCPWFLVVSGYDEFKKDVDKKLLAKLEKGKLPTKLPDSTPIDSFEYFKHVIIHEFAHTEPAKKLSADKPATDHKYEWENCLKLPGSLGCDNADSIAFFIRGAHLIKMGTRITEDGSFETI